MKIADLGIAKVQELSGGQVQTKIGTVVYEAPEMIRGAQYGSEVDVWGVGMIGYELCKLQLAFGADEHIAPRRIVEDEPEPIAVKGSGGSEGL